MDKKNYSPFCFAKTNMAIPMIPKQNDKIPRALDLISILMTNPNPQRTINHTATLFIVTRFPFPALFIAFFINNLWIHSLHLLCFPFFKSKYINGGSDAAITKL